MEVPTIQRVKYYMVTLRSLSKPYDMEPHEELWRRLEEQKLPSQYMLKIEHIRRR